MENEKMEPAEQAEKKQRKPRTTKSPDEKLLEVQQKINRLKQEQKRLQKEKDAAERKKRDHAMILVGAHFLTFFSESEREMIVNMSDEEIKKWVDKKFIMHIVGEEFASHFKNETKRLPEKNEAEIRAWVNSKFVQN